jgi:hypothetical protein
MLQDSTDRLTSVLEGQPEYVLAFMAEVGGDPSDYIEGASLEVVDFQQVGPAQIGDALHQFVLAVPPPELPSDLDIADVDWAAIGGRLEQILTASMGGM